MRTTIELPSDLRQKLATEAVLRNMKGYSGIISEAICAYFKTCHSKRKQSIDNLKGCLSEKEYRLEMDRLKEGRGNWRE